MNQRRVIYIGDYTEVIENSTYNIHIDSFIGRIQVYWCFSLLIWHLGFLVFGLCHRNTKTPRNDHQIHPNYLTTVPKQFERYNHHDCSAQIAWGLL